MHESQVSFGPIERYKDRRLLICFLYYAVPFPPAFVHAKSGSRRKTNESIDRRIET